MNMFWEKKNTSHIHLKMPIFSDIFFRLVRDYRRALSMMLTKHLELTLNSRQKAIMKNKNQLKQSILDCKEVLS